MKNGRNFRGVLRESNFAKQVKRVCKAEITQLPELRLQDTGPRMLCKQGTRQR